MYFRSNYFKQFNGFIQKHMLSITSWNISVKLFVIPVPLEAVKSVPLQLVIAFKVQHVAGLNLEKISWTSWFWSSLKVWQRIGVWFWVNTILLENRVLLSSCHFYQAKLIWILHYHVKCLSICSICFYLFFLQFFFIFLSFF